MSLLHTLLTIGAGLLVGFSPPLGNLPSLGVPGLVAGGLLVFLTYPPVWEQLTDERNNNQDN